ncbi:MAG: TauD/TfdA family dioxygenase [Rhodovibrionaceae bacterium]
MPLELRPLSEPVGVEILGLDLTKQIDPQDQERLREAFLKHHLLLVRGQELDDDQEIAFAEIFGEVSHQGGNMKHDGKIMHISNAHEKGAFPTGPLLFHSDHVFYEHPLKAIALYGEAIPSEGGDTLFANAALAWDRLSPELKERVGSLKGLNVYDYGVNKGSDRFAAEALSESGINAIHPIAWPHPETGRKILLVNRLMTDRILDLDKSESDALLEKLFQAIDDEEIIYRHRWQLHDLVIWDNRVLQHARTDFNPQEKRVLRRVPIGEDAQIEEERRAAGQA